MTASGRLAQLVRALPSHGRGHWFESGIAHTLNHTRSDSRLWFCYRSTCVFKRADPVAPTRTDRIMSRSTQVATFASMSSEKFTDEYGFTGPLPTTSSQRVVPTGNFRPGLSIGEPAPDFELPNHRGEIVSFHADRNGARTALLFYRSVVW